MNGETRYWKILILPSLLNDMEVAAQHRRLIWMIFARMACNSTAFPQIKIIILPILTVFSGAFRRCSPPSTFFDAKQLRHTFMHKPNILLHKYFRV